MINRMQAALIKKDLRGVAMNKRLLPILLIVPIMFTIVFPTIIVLVVALAPIDSQSFKDLLHLLPIGLQEGEERLTLIRIILNNLLPGFFLLIPIMSASVMAASSFIGEKEKRTLETLLFCPLTLKQIFQAKVFASFLLSMLISVASFLVMMIVLQTESLILLGSMIMPNVSWLLLMLLVAPAVSMLSITLIVRGSAKAQTVEESQQRSIFLILPIILITAGQFTGVMIINAWLLLVMGIILAAIAAIALKGAVRKFTYETLME